MRKALSVKLQPKGLAGGIPGWGERFLGDCPGGEEPCYLVCACQLEPRQPEQPEHNCGGSGVWRGQQRSQWPEEDPRGKRDVGTRRISLQEVVGLGVKHQDGRFSNRRQRPEREVEVMVNIQVGMQSTPEEEVAAAGAGESGR